MNYGTMQWVLMLDRISFAGDLITMGHYFFKDPENYDEGGIAKLQPEAGVYAQALADALQRDESSFTADRIKEIVSETASGLDVKQGKLMFPMRLAVTGMTVGPALFDSIALIGKERCVSRLERASRHFGQSRPST